MISEKYVAGFLDADGYIGLAFRDIGGEFKNTDTKKCFANVEFTQKASHDEVLHMIHQMFGGSIGHNKANNSTQLKLFGKRGAMLLERVKKYLVIKRHYAEVALSLHQQVVSRKETQKLFKQAKSEPCLPLPNYPSRKWMAGYMDGDGCFSAKIYGKDKNYVGLQMSVVAELGHTEGLDLIHKAFGGGIGYRGNDGRLARLDIQLPPSKAEQVLGHFAKHLIVKKSQADFILKCAEGGNYRDGLYINDTLKLLKTHQHRLSESASLVSALASNIKFDINGDYWKGTRQTDWVARGNKCVCGSTEHYLYGLCEDCSREQRLANRRARYKASQEKKRQSDQAIPA